MKLPVLSLSIAILSLAVVGYATLHRPAPITNVIEEPSPVTIEYTRNNELQPPVHVKGAVSIHIISDENGKLSDVQVFPLPDPSK